VQYLFWTILWYYGGASGASDVGRRGAYFVLREGGAYKIPNSNIQIPENILAADYHGLTQIGDGALAYWGCQ
jgi:hypothetical protein